MKKMIVILIASVCLTGCPFPDQPAYRLIASVHVIATCPTPGAPCEFEHVTRMEEGVFEAFDVTSEARRDMDAAVAIDDVTVEFISNVPIMGYHVGMNNEVVGETQTFMVTHTEGIDGIEAVYNWKMKIALDDQNQYELQIDFFGAPL